MAKRPAVSTITSGYNSTTVLNDNFTATRDAFDNTLSLDGSTPNAMTADFDLNSNNILNGGSITATGITLNGVGITPTSVAATPAASAITITDAGGYYTATEVEAALQELPTQYQPLGYAPGAMVFIESQDASASSTLDFTGFDAAQYDSYQFVLSNVTPTTDAVSLNARLSTNGGSSYLSTAIYDRRSVGQAGTVTVATVDQQTAQSWWALHDNTDEPGNAAGEDGFSGTMKLYGPHLVKKTYFTCDGYLMGDTAGEGTLTLTGGHVIQPAAHNAIRFQFDSGTIASGTITMYGLRNS